MDAGSAPGVAEPAARPDWVAALGDDPASAFVPRDWARAAAQPGAWFDAALAEAAVAVRPA